MLAPALPLGDTFWRLGREVVARMNDERCCSPSIGNSLSCGSSGMNMLNQPKLSSCWLSNLLVEPSVGIQMAWDPRHKMGAVVTYIWAVRRE